MVTRRSGALYYNRRRRRAAQDLHHFTGLIAAPEDLGSAVAGAALTEIFLPANVTLAVSLDAATSAGDIVVSDGTRDLSIVGGAASRVFSLGHVERGPVTVNRGATAPAGQLSLLVIDEWGRARTIATGTFS